jgi:hypothetical protein
MHNATYTATTSENMAPQAYRTDRSPVSFTSSCCSSLSRLFGIRVPLVRTFQRSDTDHSSSARSTPAPPPAKQATTLVDQSNQVHDCIVNVQQQTRKSNDDVQQQHELTTMTTTPFENVDIVQHSLENDDFVQQIVSFVGPNQYHFVAAINHTFRLVHHTLYPYNHQTYYNISTVQHATICCEDRHRNRSPTLCNLATQRGNLPVLKCLRLNGCPWDEQTCSGAARNGRFAVL